MANVRIGNRIFNGIEGVLLNNQTSGSTLYSLMDWGENSTKQPNYVKNRPFWNEKKEIVWDGTSNLISNLPEEVKSSFNVTDLAFLPNYNYNFMPELMVNGEVDVVKNNNSAQKYTIAKYCHTITQFAHACQDLDDNNIIIVNGGAFGLPNTAHLGCLPNDESSPIVLFAILPANAIGNGTPAGLYVSKAKNSATSDTYYLTKLIFNDIIFNKDYEVFFNYLRNPMYIIPIDADPEAVLSQDLSSYQPGDLLLLTLNDPSVLLSK